MKYLKAITASIIFLVILVVLYTVHIKYFRVDVVFYSAIIDCLLATSLSAGLLFTIRYFDVFNNFEKMQMVAVWILAGYALSISVPTVIDRSLSFYILEKIQQRGGGIKFSNFEDVFVKEYLKEHRLVDVRLTEQRSSGTIVIQNGCVKLTERGKKIATFSRYFRQNLLPKQRLLMGEYTDDLTDPFRDGESMGDYSCVE